MFFRGIDIAGALMDAASTSAFFTNTGVSSLACLRRGSSSSWPSSRITHPVHRRNGGELHHRRGWLHIPRFRGFAMDRALCQSATSVLAVSTGVKIMLLYLLIGAGMNLSVDWMSDAQQVGTSAQPAMGAFEIMGAALIFMMLCWQVPKLFSAVLGGSPALTGGDLLSTGTGLVAGAATIGQLRLGERQWRRVLRRLSAASARLPQLVALEARGPALRAVGAAAS